MSADQMNEIRKLFCERMKVEKIDEAKSLKDFGLDSLDVVEMCLDLEDKYGIEFSPEELAEFKTVGDLLASIEAKLAK
ncbi:MAG: acyl carrier protein [Bacilli bacterium]|nr:acyl carrier protein [Bacilli bacterium]MBR6866529.1 acyl carrier protein [Bacilli bacterium]